MSSYGISVNLAAIQEGRGMVAVKPEEVDARCFKLRRMGDAALRWAALVRKLSPVALGRVLVYAWLRAGTGQQNSVTKHTAQHSARRLGEQAYTRKRARTLQVA